jgi:ribosomal 30S subunit maturation factor RimM
VESARPFQDRWIVQFEGIVDRSQAERMRGIELVGATVFDIEGTELGSVRAVEANPASDLLVLESGGLIPLRFVTERDATARTLVVDIPDGLLDP